MTPILDLDPAERCQRLIANCAQAVEKSKKIDDDNYVETGLLDCKVTEIKTYVEFEKKEIKAKRYGLLCSLVAHSNILINLISLEVKRAFEYTPTELNFHVEKIDEQTKKLREKHRNFINLTKSYQSLIDTDDYNKINSMELELRKQFDQQIRETKKLLLKVQYHALILERVVSLSICTSNLRI